MFSAGNLVALFYATIPVLRHLSVVDHYLGLSFPHTPFDSRAAHLYLTGTSLQLYGALVFLAVFASLGWVAYHEIPRLLQRGSSPSAIELALGGRGVLPVLAGCWVLNLMVSLLFMLFSYLAGNPAEIPDFNKYNVFELLFRLANAAVWEEVTFRLVALGLPLGAWHLASRSRNAQPWHRYLLGGGFHADTAVLMLTLLSSLYFGYAHVVHGWGWWKLIPTTVAGLMMAWLFLRWGLAHSITFHFLIDYSGTLILLSGQGELPGVLVPFEIASQIAMVLGFFIALPLLGWLLPAYARGVARQVTGLFDDAHDADPP